ncbi:AraC family transcriptional regulator [Paenibacillus sp. J5C_2022]|nr:AraC family transcriptional regulator [Paenibacillus sp. J5C2022]
MNKFRLRKPSIRFLKYFFSYVLLVVLLLLTVGSLVYAQVIETLREEVERSNQAMLKQISDMMDVRVQEMHRISVQIASHPQLKSFKMAQGGYDTLRAVRELKTFISTNSFLYDLALYSEYQGEGRFYAASGTYGADMFFEHIYKYDTWELNDFLQAGDDLTMPLLRPVETLKAHGADGIRMATLLYPLQTSTEGSRQVLLFLIKGSELQRMLEKVFQGYNGYASILDRDGTPILSVSRGDNGADEAEFLNLMGNGALSGEQGGAAVLGDYAVVKQVSDYTKWSYAVAIPTGQMMKKVNDTKAIFYWTAVIAVIIGALVSYVLAWGAYRPLRQLVESIGRKRLNAVARSKDELVWLSQQFDHISDENRGLRVQLNTRLGMVKEQFLFKLMQGSICHADELNGYIDSAELRLGGPRFAILWFWIDDYEWFELKNNNKMQNLLRYSIMNVAEELALNIGHGYAAVLGDVRGIAMIVSIEQEESSTVLSERLAEEAAAFFRDNFPFTITVGISDEFQELLAAPKYVDQACRAAAYRFLLGSNRVIRQRDLPVKSERAAEYRKEQEERIIHALVQGQSEEVERLLREIISEFKHDGIVLADAEKICALLVNTIQKSLQEFDLRPDPELKSRLDRVFSLNYETIMQFEAELVHCCRMIADCSRQAKESKNFELRDKLFMYLDQTYGNPGQCLDTIANEFNMSPSYLTRYFKNQTGYSLIEYLDHLRLQHAKRLLRETDRTVKEIVELVGYTDVNNFNRKFKKKEGATPTEYKRMLMQ